MHYSARAGINRTRQELHAIDQVVSPLIDQGQSPYQILTTLKKLQLRRIDPNEVKLSPKLIRNN